MLPKEKSHISAAPQARRCGRAEQPADPHAVHLVSAERVPPTAHLLVEDQPVRRGHHLRQLERVGPATAGAVCRVWAEKRARRAARRSLKDDVESIAHGDAVDGCALG